jgi:Multidrug resistance efflux pump
MSKQLFPPEVIEFSSEKLINDYSKKSRIIYNLIIFAVLAALVSIFFIKVDVSVNGSGILRSEQDKATVTAPCEGRITKWSISENQSVKKNDTLLILEDTQYQLQIQTLRERKEELQLLLADLDILITKPNEKQLQSVYYKQSYSAYLSDLSERENRLKLLRKRYERDKNLFENKVESEYNFEFSENEYKSAKINLQLFKNKHIDQWQDEILRYNNELRTISEKIEQLENQSERLVLLSPCNGNIQQIAGLDENMFVIASQLIAVISPDGRLIAECVVAPKDIGYIKEGMDVNFQMQAYNYNYWGVVKGKVESISKDIIISQATDKQTAFFKVKCKLNDPNLKLQNGYKVELQKGLTFSAQFLITRRTIFQLLYDKIDDWLNPNQINDTKYQTIKSQ